MIGWYPLLPINLISELPLMLNIFLMFSVVQFIGYVHVFDEKDNDNLVLGLSISVPLVLSIFVLSWIFCSIIFGLDEVEHRRDVTIWAIAVTVFLLSSLKIKGLFLEGFCIQKFFLNVGASFLVGFVAVMFQFIAPKYVVGDSFYFVNWAASGTDLLRSGLPLVGTAIANLSNLISVDFYLFALHNTLAISLLVAVISFFLCGRFNTEVFAKSKNSRAMVLFGIAVITMFVLSPMFFRQLVYVNFHVFAACLFLFPCLILYNSFFKPSKQAILIIGLLLCALTVVRLEGGLLAMLVLWCVTLFSRGRFKPFWLTFGVCSISFLYLFTGFGLLSKYTFLSQTLATWLIFITLCFPLVNKLLVTNLSHSLLIRLSLVVVFVTLIAITIMEPQHMLWNVGLMLVNLNPVFWGGAGFVIFLGLAGWFKDLQVNSIYEDDAFFGYVLFMSISLIIFLTFLRDPLRLGMNDSVNRILFQLFPLFLLLAVQQFEKISSLFRRLVI